jgi:lipopolysaccharide transport system permease protein
VDFGISAALLVALVLAFGIPVSGTWFAFLPVLLAIQCMFIVGLGLGCAALNVFYRDVDPVVKLGLQIWFYASPVIYPVSLVPQRWHWLYFANPMAGVIEGYRDVLLEGRAPGAYVWVAAAMAVLMLLLGYGFFKRVEGRFADII